MQRQPFGADSSNLRQRQLDRRRFLARATSLGLTAGAAPVLGRTTTMLAQRTSPAASPIATPTTTGHDLTSMTRDEYWAAVRAAFPLQAPARTGGIAIYGETSDIQVLNPNLAADVYSTLVTGLVFDGLVTISALDGTPAPGLADFWERSDDGLIYTFHLNQNATWHDGQPVTAADVVFSFESILAAESLSPRKSTVEAYLAEVRAIDDHTVALRAMDRYATFIENTASLVAVLPRHIWQAVPPEEWGRDPGSTGQDPRRVIGSGPFTFREWVANDHVTIAKRAGHWDPDIDPSIDEFIFRVMPEATTALQAFDAGEIDVVDLEPSQVESLRESVPGATISAFDTTNFTYYLPQQDPARTSLFVDVPVRQAMLYALDRQLIVERVFLGYAIQANGTQPVLSVAYRPDAVTTIYNYDPAHAAQLLDAAGWITGADGIRTKDGVRFSFECLFAEGVATLQQLLPYMQQAWREVGIEMTPASVPFTTLLDAIDTGDFAMALLGFSWSVEGSQGDMYRCDAVPLAGLNHMRYCNPRYDELDAAQARELDEGKRIDLLVAASNLVNDEAANGILVFSKDIISTHPRIHNALPNGFNPFWWLPFAWVEED